MALRTFHLCISIRGMLRWDKRETIRNLKNITKSDGTRFSCVDEFRNYLYDEIARGRDVLPIGEICEGFDYKHGCRGHSDSSAQFPLGTSTDLCGEEPTTGYPEAMVCSVKEANKKD